MDTKVLVGLRRLYLAPGVTVEAPVDSVEWTIGAHVVRISVTTTPAMGISEAGGERRGFVTGIGKQRQIRIGVPPADLGYGGHWFTELICGFYTDVEVGLVEAARRGDVTAAQTMLANLEGFAAEINRTLDLVVGVVALKCHLQLVRRLLCQEVVALAGKEAVGRSFAGPVWEMLLDVQARGDLAHDLQGLLQAIASGPDRARHFCAAVLSWLGKAWDDQSDTGRFVALFIPLEMVLSDIGRGEVPVSPAEERLRTFIAQKAGEGADQLAKDLETVRGMRSISLNARFERLARMRGGPTVEADIKAFRHFNDLRNQLLHRGKPSFSPIIMVGNDVVADLEDLVERYVMYKLFGLKTTFLSRFRHYQQRNVVRP